MGERLHRGGGVRQAGGRRRLGRCAETLIDGETGILVDGTEVGEVADAVASLLGDPARAAAMGEAGRARVLRSHRWPDIAAQLGEWLSEAAASA
jgi:phosphatidylinositol alpha-1,6-mannosyltransferase